MRGSSRIIAVVALVIALTVPYTLGHSYLTNPISRSNQRQSNSGCRGPACLGPCDVNKANAITPAKSVQRGQTVSIEWPRNNHAGGFIRLAWASFDQSDSHSAFDNGVEKVVCHEIGGCGPDDPTNPNGGDSGPSDGSSRACKTSLTIPQHLSDGKWTLQWAWFGGAFALSDYYSCVDFQVSGGASGARADPVFNGGDYSNPGKDVCKYFNTDALHICTNEPCLNPPRPGQNVGPVANSTLWGSSKPSSSSSGSSSSSSSGSTSSSSGGSTVPPTTPATTPASSSSSSGSSSGTATTPATTPASSSSGSTSSSSGNASGDMCLSGTTKCDPAPGSSATYQCCSSGAACFSSGGSGVCCGPYTSGCIYTSSGVKKSDCCDTRYLKCDSAQGCIAK